MLLMYLLMVWVVGGAVGHAPCSEAEHRSMQERFTACRSRHQWDEGTADICHTLRQVLRGCGEVWQECHTSHEIQTLESMHVERIREQWKDREAELVRCPLFGEVR